MEFYEQSLYPLPMMKTQKIILFILFPVVTLSSCSKFETIKDEGQKQTQQQKQPTSGNESLGTEQPAKNPSASGQTPPEGSASTPTPPADSESTPLPAPAVGSQPQPAPAQGNSNSQQPAPPPPAVSTPAPAPQPTPVPAAETPPPAASNPQPTEPSKPPVVVTPPAQSSAPTPTPAPTQAPTNACQSEFVKGKNIDPSSIVEDVQTVFFQKKMDKGLMQSTLSGSAQAIAKLAESLGLQLYRAEGKGDCQFFEPIAQPPVDFLNFWNKADEDDLILGLFLPPFLSKSISNGSEEKSVIMLRSDSDKWTLVHEFMHFLFEKERTKQDPSLSEQINQRDQVHFEQFIKVAQTALDSVGELKENQFETYAKAMVEFSESRMDMAESYPLEEMAIEAQLISIFDHPEGLDLTTVKPWRRKMGSNYISESFFRFYELLLLIKKGTVFSEETKNFVKVIPGIDDLRAKMATESKDLKLNERIEKISQRMAQQGTEAQTLLKTYGPDEFKDIEIQSFKGKNLQLVQSAVEERALPKKDPALCSHTSVRLVPEAIKQRAVDYSK